MICIHSKRQTDRSGLVLGASAQLVVMMVHEKTAEQIILLGHICLPVVKYSPALAVGPR